MPKSIDLEKVATDNGLKNVTTGDGTFENYMATNYSTATEIGFGMGMPLFKFMELYPAFTNEDLMGEIAKDTTDAGGNAIINCTPTQEAFYGFIIGMYIDYTSGTGIKTR
jgi:hypothetical protein